MQLAHVLQEYGGECFEILWYVFVPVWQRLAMFPKCPRSLSPRQETLPPLNALPDPTVCERPQRVGCRIFPLLGERAHLECSRRAQRWKQHMFLWGMKSLQSFLQKCYSFFSLPVDALTDSLCCSCPLWCHPHRPPTRPPKRRSAPPARQSSRSEQTWQCISAGSESWTTRTQIQTDQHPKKLDKQY